MKVKITRGSVRINGKEHTAGDVLDAPADVLKSLEGSRTLDFEKVQEDRDPAPPEPIAPPVSAPPKTVEEEPAKKTEPKAKATAKKKDGAKSAKTKKGKR